MSQNIYDQEEFFNNYAQLPRSEHGLSHAPEWPNLRLFLPSDLTGHRILDLGCGFGWFCRWAASEGAAAIHGVDLSENMLGRARRMTAEDGSIKEGLITYQRADLDHLKLPEDATATYDVVFSSLALHYLVNLPDLVAQAHRVLVPGGVFVCSVEHPIYTAPSRPELITGSTPEEGTEGKKWRYWPLDDYQKEGLRVTSWLAEGVKKQHRTIGTYINIFLSAGFELAGFEEWKPTAEEVQKYPSWANSYIKPTFLLLQWKKP